MALKEAADHSSLNQFLNDRKAFAPLGVFHFHFHSPFGRWAVWSNWWWRARGPVQPSDQSRW